MNMTPFDLASALVRAWTRIYTWRMKPSSRRNRRAEIESDLWEFEHDLSARRGLAPAAHLMMRLLAGIPDDLSWRIEHANFLVTSGRRDMSVSQKVNWASTAGLIVLSLTALMTVLPFALRALVSGHVPQPETDEGIGAHVFQLSIAALVLMGFMFLVTADWMQPLRSVRLLAFPAVAVLLAFSILFYFEHYYLPAHGAPLPRPGLPLRLLRQVLGAPRA